MALQDMEIELPMLLDRASAHMGSIDPLQVVPRDLYPGHAWSHFWKRGKEQRTGSKRVGDEEASTRTMLMNLPIPTIP